MERPAITYLEPEPTPFVKEVRAKTAWIRDELEPVVALRGPEHLESDTILELASFFSRLLAHSSSLTLNVPSHASSSLLAPSRSEAIPPKLTLHDLQVSRIHLALILITSKGTRWPMKLVEVCDSLKEIWTTRFGDLNKIRPLLYEEGGTLHHVKEEKDMSRHAVLVKWMSDRTSLVSPLRALETGHLEYTPGQWWIHPLFAFHDGIIDSPDPRGGITADRDGAYAILLTGDDEIDSDVPDFITYRTRKDDHGKHRLIQAILPTKQSVRVLRSHVLQSLWSPIVGLRYEGLYQVVGYSVSTDRDGDIRLDARLQRDSNQTDMKEVLKHPTAEEVDAYVEYKRLRSIRSRKRRDMSKVAPKSDQVLGAIQPMQDPEQELELEKETQRDFFSQRRGAIPPENQESTSDDQVIQITSTNKFLDESQSRVIPSLDGAEVQPALFDPTLNLTDLPFLERLRDCCNDHGEQEIPEIPEDTLPHHRSANFPESQSTYELTSKEIQDGDLISLSHSGLRILKGNLTILGQAIQRRKMMSREFHQDLVCIKHMTNQLEITMMEKYGWVDKCVSDLASQLNGMTQTASIAGISQGGVMSAILESAHRDQISFLQSLSNSFV